MRQINVYFENSEFELLEDLKNNMSWRKFIVLLVTHAKEAIKRGDLKIE